MTSSTEEPSAASHHDSNAEWEVQDILAARTSVTGDDEVLVVWKPCWTPVGCVKDGPGIRRYQNALKWKFTSAVSGMRVILPVEPGTQLADDHAEMQKMAVAAKCKHGKDGKHGPRKPLGSDAQSKRHKSSQQAQHDHSIAADRSPLHAQEVRPSGPRKSLGAVAKRKPDESSQD
jgi:hypothetical protein